MYLCILLSNIIRYFKIFLHDAHTHLEMLKVSKNMLKISKSVKNYSKYNLQIFAGKYDKFAGNFRNCRQSIFAGKLPAKPMSTVTWKLGWQKILQRNIFMFIFIAIALVLVSALSSYLSFRMITFFQSNVLTMDNGDFHVFHVNRSVKHIFVR